jgi:hypothetical protein
MILTGFIIGSIVWTLIIVAYFLVIVDKEKSETIIVDSKKNFESLTPKTATKKPIDNPTTFTASVNKKEEIIPQRREVLLNLSLTEENYNEEYIIDITRTLKDLIEKDDLIKEEPEEEENYNNQYQNHPETNQVQPEQNTTQDENIDDYLDVN